MDLNLILFVELSFIEKEFEEIVIVSIVNIKAACRLLTLDYFGV